MIVKQVDIDDVKSGDQVWNIHDQEWITVDYVFKPEDGVDVILNYSGGDISAEFGHQMFRRLRRNEF